MALPPLIWLSFNLVPPVVINFTAPNPTAAIGANNPVAIFLIGLKIVSLNNFFKGTIINSSNAFVIVLCICLNRFFVWNLSSWNTVLIVSPRGSNISSLMYFNIPSFSEVPSPNNFFLKSSEAVKYPIAEPAIIFPITPNGPATKPAIAPTDICGKAFLNFFWSSFVINPSLSSEPNISSFTFSDLVAYPKAEPSIIPPTVPPGSMPIKPPNPPIVPNLAIVGNFSWTNLPTFSSNNPSSLSDPNSNSCTLSDLIINPAAPPAEAANRGLTIPPVSNDIPPPTIPPVIIALIFLPTPISDIILPRVSLNCSCCSLTYSSSDINKVSNTSLRPVLITLPISLRIPGSSLVPIKASIAFSLNTSNLSGSLSGSLYSPYSALVSSNDFLGFFSSSGKELRYFAVSTLSLTALATSLKIPGSSLVPIKSSLALSNLEGSSPTDKLPSANLPKNLLTILVSFFLCCFLSVLPL